MKAIIVSGGTAPSFELLKEDLEHKPIIIGADSGGNCLFNYGIVPNYLIGDFDSIDREALKHFVDAGVCIESFQRDKDYTDTQLAIRKAIELECNDIVLFGCSGNRIDHTLGNIGLLIECLQKGIKAYLKDDINIVTLADCSTEIEGIKGEVFSLQAYCDCVKELTITGAKFELNNYDLKLGDPLTISNEFLYDKVNIKFKSGLLLIIKNRILL